MNPQIVKEVCFVLLGLSLACTAIVVSMYTGPIKPLPRKTPMKPQPQRLRVNAPRYCRTHLANVRHKLGPKAFAVMVDEKGCDVCAARSRFKVLDGKGG